MYQASFDLSAILSSQARFRVLQTLAHLTEGLRLRELERECDLNIRSIQLATQALRQEKVLRKTTDGYFLFDDKSSAAIHIRALFRFLRDEEIRKNARSLSTRAKAVIRLSEEMRHLVSMGRGSIGNR